MNDIEYRHQNASAFGFSNRMPIVPQQSVNFCFAKCVPQSEKNEKEESDVRRY